MPSYGAGQYVLQAESDSGGATNLVFTPDANLVIYLDKLILQGKAGLLLTDITLNMDTAGSVTLMLGSALLVVAGTTTGYTGLGTGTYAGTTQAQPDRQIYDFNGFELGAADTCTIGIPITAVTGQARAIVVFRVGPPSGTTAPSLRVSGLATDAVPISGSVNVGTVSGVVTLDDSPPINVVGVVTGAVTATLATGSTVKIG